VAREKLKISETEAANLLGVSRSNLRLLECGGSYLNHSLDDDFLFIYMNILSGYAISKSQSNHEDIK